MDWSSAYATDVGARSCMCIRMHVYACACACGGGCSREDSVHVRACASACARACTRTCMCTHVHVHARACARVCTCVCTCMYAHVHVRGWGGGRSCEKSGERCRMFAKWAAWPASCISVVRAVCPDPIADGSASDVKCVTVGCHVPSTRSQAGCGQWQNPLLYSVGVSKCGSQQNRSSYVFKFNRVSARLRKYAHASAIKCEGYGQGEVRARKRDQV